MTNKYDVDPARLEGRRDVVDYIREAYDRLDSNETGLKIGNTAIEDGNLTVRNGDIVVVNSNDVVIMRIIGTPAVPEIRFWPLGEVDTFATTIYSYDDVDAEQAIVVQVQTHPGGVTEGGKLILRKRDAIFSHHPLASSGQETYIWLNADWHLGGSGLINMRGRFGNDFQYDGYAALLVGSVAVGSGFSGMTQAYTVTFATDVAPIVTITNTGGTVSWNLTAQSTSSFTVSWSGTAAKTVNFSVFRM